MNAEKQKQVQEFLKQTNKEHGENSVIYGDAARQKVDVISTGSLEIDLATGIGGIPKGRITEVYGAESSAKTTLALHSIANIQKAGGTALMVDAEHALDPTYAKNLGVDLKSIAISQPDTGEQALSIILAAANTGAFDLIVLDTVAAMVTRAEMDGEVGDAHMAVLARLMSANLKKFIGPLLRSNTALICLNQIRNVNFSGYGDPTGTPAGRAMKFYASMRIQMTRSTLNKDGSIVNGNTVKVKVVKNKLAAPFRECEPEVIYGEGFSRNHEIVKLGSDNGFITKGGSWYTVGSERFQGMDNIVQYLNANQSIADSLELQIKERLGM